MAIYHFSSKIFTRSKGHSACAAAAYRSGEKIIDHNTGEIHDYRRKQQVDYSCIFAPKESPEWAIQRERLWNEVEAIEKRKDSQVAREYEMALPIELDSDDQKKLALEFAKVLAHIGMVVDLNIHHLGGDNPHVHLLCTTRSITYDGFGSKIRKFNSKSFLDGLRKLWADYSNVFLSNSGADARIDHRSYERQLNDQTPCAKESKEQMNTRLKLIEYKLPQIHKGKALHHMEKKGASNLNDFERFNEYQRRLLINDNYQDTSSKIEVEIKAYHDAGAKFMEREESERIKEQEKIDQDKSDLFNEMYEAQRDGVDMSQFSCRVNEIKERERAASQKQKPKDKQPSQEPSIKRKRAIDNDDDFSISF